jgi:hypothetical protein
MNLTEDELVGSITRSEKSPKDNLCFMPITENETFSLINSLRTDCALGPDGISTKIIKFAGHSLVYPLTHIINFILFVLFC